MLVDQEHSVAPLLDFLYSLIATSIFCLRGFAQTQPVHLYHLSFILHVFIEICDQ